MSASIYKVGMDYGTTNSAIAYLEEEGDSTLYKTVPESGSEPTLVFVGSDSRLKFGALAKKAACRGGGKSFQGFKMLIGENEEALLQKGAEKAFLPREITRQYIRNLLSRYLKDVQRGEDHYRVDELVVCVPAIWYEGEQADNRGILMDICREVLDELAPGPEGGKKHVRTLSEPVSASMYFVDRYQKHTGTPFSGYLLLVDYGGGTLDVTLNRIVPKTGEDGQVRPMVSLQGMWGAGENHDGRIGRAGMAYLQSVVETAWEEQQKEPLPKEKSSGYWDGVYSLEDELCSAEGQEEIEASFALDVDVEALNKEEFRTIELFGEPLAVSFGLLYRCYEKTIRPVLGEALNQAKEFMKREKISSAMKDADHFKIAMAGGFCNFYLVRRQVLEELNCLEDDRRILNESRSRCEQAIAYGAALKANDRMEDQMRTPYYLGIYNKEPSGDVAYWAVRKGDTIRYGEPQWIRLYDPVKKEYGEMGEFAFTNFTRLAINTDDDPTHAYTGCIPEEASRELRRVAQLNEDLFLRYRIGFAFDESSILSIYFEEGVYERAEWVSRKILGPIRIRGIGEILGARMLNKWETVIDGGAR